MEDFQEHVLGALCTASYHLRDWLLLYNGSVFHISDEVCTRWTVALFWFPSRSLQSITGPDILSAAPLAASVEYVNTNVSITGCHTPGRAFRPREGMFTEPLPLCCTPFYGSAVGLVTAVVTARTDIASQYDSRSVAWELITAFYFVRVLSPGLLIIVLWKLKEKENESECKNITWEADYVH